MQGVRQAATPNCRTTRLQKIDDFLADHVALPCETSDDSKSLFFTKTVNVPPSVVETASNRRFVDSTNTVVEQSQSQIAVSTSCQNALPQKTSAASLTIRRNRGGLLLELQDWEDWILL